MAGQRRVQDYAGGRATTGGVESSSGWERCSYVIISAKVGKMHSADTKTGGDMHMSVDDQLTMDSMGANDGTCAMGALLVEN